MLSIMCCIVLKYPYLCVVNVRENKKAPEQKTLNSKY